MCAELLAHHVDVFSYFVLVLRMETKLVEDQSGGVGGFLSCQEKESLSTPPNLRAAFGDKMEYLLTEAPTPQCKDRPAS